MMTAVGGRDLDRRTVAALAQRSPETVRRWEREGRIRRTGCDADGRAVYSAPSVGKLLTSITRSDHPVPIWWRTAPETAHG
jgi:predicted site-specific integrase-resolvase